jgi:hypothetical protein
MGARRVYPNHNPKRKARLKKWLRRWPQKHHSTQTSHDAVLSMASEKYKQKFLGGAARCPESPVRCVDGPCSSDSHPRPAGWAVGGTSDKAVCSANATNARPRNADLQSAGRLQTCATACSFSVERREQDLSRPVLASGFPYLLEADPRRGQEARRPVAIANPYNRCTFLR